MVSYKIFTLFPDIITTYIQNNAPIKRGIENGIVEIKSINFRNYAHDKHKKVDDLLYGGGPGLLLKPDVLVEAVESNITPQTKIFILDPGGEVYTQKMAQEISEYKDVALICGRYEGFDARIKQVLKARSISLGDYVLTGGELGALAVMDSALRLIPGVCDNYLSVLDESFSKGLLEADQYTRPYEFRGLKVPDVLINGNHKEINAWKKRNSLKNSIKSRPDLIKDLHLMDINLEEMAQVIKEMFLWH